MTRILAFTDPHGDISAARAIVKLARLEMPDLFCCSGDFTYFGERYLKFLELLEELHQEVLFVPGNHESEDSVKRIKEEFRFMREVTYRSVARSGVNVVGLPATLEYWPGDKSDPDTVNLCKSLWNEVDRQRPLVLLVHYPPKGTAVCGMAKPSPDSGGSQVVREVVEMLNPNLVLCGHYHQDFKKRGELSGIPIVNPGPRGTIIEI